MHRCESWPGRACLKQFFDEQLSDIHSESEFRYNQWDTTDWASLTNHRSSVTHHRYSNMRGIQRCTH